MKLRKVKLTNWCQFANLEQDLGNGLIGIVGNNGRGKSNILKAIIFACTGWTAQPRDEYIRSGYTTGSVEVDFQTDSSGKWYRVVRALNRPDVTLYESNGDSWIRISNKSSDARELLEELIPITKEFAEWVLDVPQEQMVALFNEVPSKRNEILQRIFSFQCLRRMRMKLMELTRVATTNRNAAEAQRMLLTDQVSQKRTWVQSFQKIYDRKLLEEDMTSISQRIGYLDTTIGQMQGIEYLRSEFNRLNSRLLDIQSSRKELPPSNPAPEENRESLVAYSSMIQAQLTTINQLYNKLKAIQKTPTIAMPESSELDNAFNELTMAQSNLTVSEQELRKLEACVKTGKCPTCGSSVPVTAQMLENARNKREALILEVSNAQKKTASLKAATDAACKAQMTLQSNWDTVRSYVRELGWRIKNSPDILTVLLEYSKQRQANCKSMLASIDESLNRLDTYMRDYSAWSNRQNTLLQQEMQIKSDLDKIQSNDLFRAKLDSSLTELTSEKDELQKRYNLLKEQYLYRVQYDSAVAQLEEVQKSLSEVESRLSSMNPELLDNLETLMAWLLPGEFPRRVCASMYHILTERMNRNLLEFDFPYTATLKENGEFICQKSDGMLQSASRLSGGEKMILSIAFRLALHDLFLSRDSAGFLMLDEPTTFLDEDNRQALKDVLARLKKSPRFGGMQIFVVTHDDSLCTLFDYLIKL